MLPLGVPGNIPGKLLCCTRGDIRGGMKIKQGPGGKELEIIWDATRSAPGASPPNSGGRTRRDE